LGDRARDDSRAPGTGALRARAFQLIRDHLDPGKRAKLRGWGEHLQRQRATSWRTAPRLRLLPFMAQQGAWIGFVWLTRHVSGSESDRPMVDYSDRFPPGVDLSVLGRTMLDAARAARIGVAVSVFDPGGRARNIYISDVAADILGWPVEELMRTDPLDHVSPEDRARVQERLEKRAGGEVGQASYELMVVRQDGRRRPIGVTATDAMLNDRPAVVAFIVDATARRAAEEAHLRAEARFRELIEKAPEPIGIFVKAHIVYANTAFVAALGYRTAEDLYPVPLSELVHANDVALMEARMRLLMDGGRPPSPYVYHVRRFDGSTLLLEISSVPFEYEGKPSILAMGRDVTERRMLEARLIQADRLAALGTLAAGVAHEINNPLAYVILNLDWIARKLSEGRQPQQSMEGLAEMLNEARGGAERVATIVRELRSFSRADDETRRGVDLAAVVRSAIKLAAHEIRPRARITTSFEPIRPVWANEGRLEQVVLNLLLNAAQALPEARAATNEIRVYVRPHSEQSAVLEVADNGEGIPPEVLPRIFDPFFTTKPLGVGTGLGLSICHGIVASLGGQITVHSMPGDGTTFHVVLQTTNVMPGDAATIPNEPLQVRPGARARVLVLDDEPQIANTLRELLAAEHDVVATTSAFDALAAVRSGGAFDVIFCDLVMPGMDGIEFYRVLRKQYPGLEQSVVFMTGGAFTRVAAEFLASVDNRHLEKPFSIGLIERIVREMKARRKGAS
jgi:PAS domain S-box-containing protein